MKQVFQAVKVTDRVYWVGAVDWKVRDFHGYLTDRGSTYNAYLVLGDRITLIDAVKRPFQDELMARISSVIDPGSIEYIVSNHTEMDHSGCLPEVIAAVRPEKVFASTMGARALKSHFQLPGEVIPVKDGETLSLGDCNLAFVETRMLHWPDSMFTYLAEERLLFSSDAFGMHLASAKRFDDETDGWEYEAARYFANILMPYAPLITKLLNRVQEMGLAIDIIAPDHGPIWRSDPGRIIDLYARWSGLKPAARAVVAYATMWQSTELMARALTEGLAGEGVDVQLMPLAACHRSTIVTELLDAGILAVGSPTLNNGLYPTVSDLLTYITGLRPKHKLAVGFGSYGWSGEAVPEITAALSDMKLDVREGLAVKYVPSADALGRMVEAGAALARDLKQQLDN